MGLIARLKTEIIADDSKFRATMKGSEASLKNFGDAFQDANGRWRAANGRFLTDMEKSAAGIKSTESAITKFGTSLKSMGANLEKVGTSLTIGLTLPLVALGKQILDVGFSYEKAMNTFQAVTKASAEEMGRAAAMAEKLGADMTLPATSAADAALAMTELAKGGFTAAQAMDAAKGSLQLAAAAQVDEAKAAEITANALNTFHLAATESVKVSDLLAAASNASSAEITDIAMSLQQAGTSAAALKIPISDLVTAIGEMASAGIKGSDAGTSLKTFMDRLTPTTKEAKEAMKDLGLGSVFVKGEFIGLEAVIAKAQPALAKMTTEQRAYAIEAAFGSDAQRAANTLLGEGTAKWNEMSGAVNQSGAAAELAAAKTKGLSGAWDGFISQLETAGLKVFQAMAPTVEKFIRGLAEMTSGFATLNPKIIEFGAVAAGVAATAGPLALLGGKLLEFGTKGAVVGVAIAGVAALAAAYKTDFAAMGQTVDDFGANMTRVFGGTVQAGRTWSTDFSQIGILFARIFDGILDTIAQMASGIKTIGQLMVAALRGNWNEIGLIYAQGRGDIDQMQARYDARQLARQEEWTALSRGGYQAHWQLLQQRATAASLTMGQTEYDAWKAANPTGKMEVDWRDAVRRMKGIMENEMPKAVGTGARLTIKAWDAETKHSPFFMIHDLDDAAQWATAELPPKLSVAGKRAASALKKAFKEELGNINDLLGSFGESSGIKIDEDIAKLIGGKTREDLQAMSKAFKANGDATQAWAITLATAFKKAGSDLSVSVKENKIRIEQGTAEIIRHVEALAKGIPPIQLKTVFQVIDEANFLEAAKRTGADWIKIQTEGFDKAKAAADEYQADLAKQGAENNEIWKKNNEKMLENAERLRDGIKSILGDGIGGVLVNLADKFGWNLGEVEGWAKDVGNAVESLPGKFGDAARKVTSTLNQWLSFGNSILSMLNKVFGESVPSSLGGLIKNISSVFSNGNSTQQVGGAISNLAKSAVQSATGAATAAGQTAGTSITGGMSSAITAGASSVLGSVTGIFGAITAAAGLFAQTFQSDSKAVRGVGAFPIGGIFGSLLAIFKGGPSQAQKEQAARDIEKSKAEVATAYQTLNQGIIDTMAKGDALLESLANRVDVPRKAIKRFINQLFLLLTEFADASKELKPEGQAAAKTVSENFGGSFELMMGAVDLNNAIRGMQEATVTDVAAFKNSSIKLFNALFAVFDEIEMSVAKQSGKKSEKLKSVIDFATAIPNAIKAAIETVKIDDSQIANAFGSARKFIDGFFAFSEELIGYALNKNSKAAGQLQGIFESGKSMFEFLGLFSAYKPFDGSVLGLITADLQKLFDWSKSTLSMVTAGISDVDKLAEALRSLATSFGGVTSGIANLTGGGRTSGITANLQYQGSGLSSLRSGGGSSSTSSTVVQHNTFQITLSLKDLEELAEVPDKVRWLERKLNDSGSRTGQKAQGYASY